MLRIMGHLASLFSTFFYRPAAFLGLISSLFATVCLLQCIYLYVRAEVHQQHPHLPLLCLFGVKGAVGISLGLGAFVAFLGLGIADSVNHKSECVLADLWFKLWCQGSLVPRLSP